MSSAHTDTLARDLAEIVGERAVIADAGRLLSYESDGLTAYRSAPRAVVLPADTDEAARVMVRLRAEGVPVVPRGAGTGLSGGAVAMGGAVMVGTSRMNRVLEVDPANRTARVQAGTVNARLSERARPHGLYYAPDPSSQTACTLGGNVAENSGGPHCLKYGVTSRYVTGLTLVLPSGEVVAPGGRESEPGGLDLVGVVIGSEGCFGLVTEVEVALLPLPEAVRTLLAVFAEMEDAARAVTDIIGSGLLPAALEIIDSETIRAVEASVFAAGYPVDAGAALVVEFDGTEAGLDDDVERARRCCLDHGASEVRRARTEEERAALWKGRKKAFGAMGRVAPDLMVQDATVPRTRLPEVLGRIREIGGRYGLRVANVFHAGDGNLHPNILFDRRDPRQLARVERASKEIMRACVEAGGTITGEHGVGVDKRHYMRLVHTLDELRTMAAVESAFDPEGRFNPGKVLPDEARRGPGPSDASGETDDGADRVAGGGVEPVPDPASPRSRAPVRDEIERLLGSDALEGEPSGRHPGVAPASTDQMSAFLRLASERGWRVMPRGAGRCPGSTRHGTPAVVLSTGRLEGVVAYEPADLTLTAGAGLSLEAVARRTAEAAQWLPLDPPGDGCVTLGGVAATGLGGPLATAFGSPRDLILGLTCVTGDGRVLSLGGRVVKNVAGFDVLKLLVGSRGSLGVITEVTVRLYPEPASERILGVRAGRIEELVPTARALSTASVLPAALELLELPDRGARLWVRVLGSEAAVEADAATLRARAPELEVTDEGAADAFGPGRALELEAGSSVRLTVPPADLAEGLARVRSLLGGNDVAVRLAADPLRGVIRAATAVGGSGTPTGTPSGGAEPLRVIHARLKRHFDPAGILPPVPEPARDRTVVRRPEGGTS